MTSNLPPNSFNLFPLVKGKDFLNWKTVNDSIMGGSSTAICRSTMNGLLLEGHLVEEGGGFVSCRSEEFLKPLNISKYKGFVLEVEGYGRTLKFAVACQKRRFRVLNLFDSNIRWVSEFKTKSNGISRVRIPFNELKPVIRAKPIRFPIKFNPSEIIQFQLLHSKFGVNGESNAGFKPGPIQILFYSISAYS